MCVWCGIFNGSKVGDFQFRVALPATKPDPLNERIEYLEDVMNQLIGGDE